ncbi:MAG: preprotein translocase subunit SecY [Candidatus Muirbacterium halophilum]|nr:preprotein translocase subunit SecY [Candidatus Muirbacterium halophilum]
MIKSLKNIFNIPELKGRILFTLMMIAVFRLGTHIPVPGINTSELSKLFSGGGGVLGFLDMFSGGALQRFSIFALGIARYINSSIIMQLLVYVIPQLEQLAKEGGEEGKMKISQYTRYGTVVIAILQGIGMTFMLRNYNVLHPYMAKNFLFFQIIAVMTLTAGTAFVMWLGEKMTEKGIGNGVSILIFAGIVARLPQAVYATIKQNLDSPLLIPWMVIIIAMALAIVAFVVIIQEATRKIPVQYAKRVVGRKVYGGHSTYIPLRINQSGVIPIIFASSILIFPGMVLQMIINHFKAGTTTYNILSTLSRWFSPSHPFHLTLFALMIVGFTYFYTAIVMNPKELADNMKKYGGFIPGIRAGRWTAEFIDRVMVRITLAGSIFLAAIALIPTILIALFKVPFYFGGTALLIVVGVASDTMKQMEAHMLTRHYEGFLKKSK